MGHELLAALFFFLLMPVVVIGFVVFWTVNARDQEEVASCWRGYAAKRGLRFVAPEGEWPNRTPAAITWREGDAEVRLTTIGREASVRTRLTVRPRAVLLGTVVWICDEGSAGRFQTSERPAGLAERVISARVKRLLLALRQRDRVTLAYRRGRVTIEWPGGELNDARLDDARRVSEELAHAIDAEFRAPASVRRQPAA